MQEPQGKRVARDLWVNSYVTYILILVLFMRDSDDWWEIGWRVFAVLFIHWFAEKRADKRYGL